MSYPPPPGLDASNAASSVLSLTSQPPSSLPPRPPPPAGPLPSFKPAFTSSPSTASGAPGTGSYSNLPHGATNAAPGFQSRFTSFAPRQVNGAAQGWQSHSPSVSAPPAPPSGFSAQSVYGANVGQPSGYQHGNGQQYYQQGPQARYNAASPPQIRNPFPLPGQEPTGRGRGMSRYQDPAVDPEREAQIAQWQSAYVSKDAAEQVNNRGGGRGHGRSGGQGVEGPASASGANAGPLGGRTDSGATSVVNTPAEGGSGAAAGSNGADGKQKTVIRSGGGTTWKDSTLLEWDPAHFRLFVGNLAGEVTDDSLLKAFSRYPSVQKARVVRDKRTTKSKGYGFVSFSDGDEYFQAAREMQGKYIGSHPVLLRRSTTEIRPVAQADKKGKHGKGGKGSNQGAGGGAKTGAGVQRKPNKTKGGLRVLG